MRAKRRTTSSQRRGREGEREGGREGGGGQLKCERTCLQTSTPTASVPVFTKTLDYCQTFSKYNSKETISAVRE